MRREEQNAIETTLGLVGAEATSHQEESLGASTVVCLEGAALEADHEAALSNTKSSHVKAAVSEALQYTVNMAKVIPTNPEAQSAALTIATLQYAAQQAIFSVVKAAARVSLRSSTMWNPVSNATEAAETAATRPIPTASA